MAVKVKGQHQESVFLWVQDRLPKLHVRRNFHFHPTRKFEIDVALPALKVGFEIDGYGGGHQRPAGFTRDRVKDIEAWLHGWQIFRFSSTQVRDGSAYDYLEKIIRRLTEEGK